MSQLLSSLLVVFLVSSVCYSKYDYLRKTLALEAFLSNPNSSMAVSTLSLRFPLCKLAAHAHRAAGNEILSVVGIQSGAALQTCYSSFHRAMTVLKDFDAITINKIIVNHTTDIQSTFIRNNSHFGVTVDQIGFNYPNLAVSFVNRWLERASIKRLTDVFEMNEIDNKTSIVIVNAAYLKVTWEFPFDIKLTKRVKFHHHDGNSSMVPMMKRTDTYLYLNDPITGARFVNVKLAVFGLSMTIVVPSTPRDLVRLINQLTVAPDVLMAVYKRMHYEHLTLMLPRFRVKTGIEWSKCLQKIGLLQIFNETNSGLNGILTTNSQIKNMYLSKVKQKNFIDVDEMGIYRLKIDNAPNMFNNPHSLNDRSGPVIIADHPFLFSINLLHDLNNQQDVYELFTGVYYGPNY